MKSAELWISESELSESERTLNEKKFFHLSSFWSSLRLAADDDDTERQISMCASF